MNIFVAKLSPSTSGDDLHTLFSDYGEVISAKVIMDRDTGQSKRYGFVEMKNDEEGYKAISELNDCEFEKSRIIVKKSDPKPSGGGGHDFKRRSNYDRGDRDRGGRPQRY
ncbi:MAG TPA: RNA-binding protein [Bacteroidales bacterium]|nr:RNA-binding protein [Bacteroidales bacterium]HPE55408.1 RNA-binding protein [Bacteroidales bacterium]HRX96099.1 RNA-binding protein [Bacteroidales bacterium]